LGLKAFGVVVIYIFEIESVCISLLVLIGCIINYSEFEELEAVPNPSTIDGPLEPAMSSSTIVPDTSEEALANFFTVCYVLLCFLHL
jgi:hypothetical protein